MLEPFLRKSVQEGRLICEYQWLWSCLRFVELLESVGAQIWRMCCLYKCELSTALLSTPHINTHTHTHTQRDRGRVLFIYINYTRHCLHIYIYINYTRPSVTLCIWETKMNAQKSCYLGDGRTLRYRLVQLVFHTRNIDTVPKMKQLLATWSFNRGCVFPIRQKATNQHHGSESFPSS